jgi:hypothetical protein
MIADPQLAGRLGYLRPADFADEWNRRVYSAVLSARRDDRLGTGDWREAIQRAGGPALVIREDLDALVSDCPDPGHGAAYGAMVIQAGAVSLLKEQARELATRARQLSDVARYPRDGQGIAGSEAGNAAGHLDRVAGAISRHAGEFGPQAVHAALPDEPGIPAAWARREETVLAALLKSGRSGRVIAEGIPAEAFRGSYRRAVFEVVAAMHRAGWPVDALTVDWELASAGLPLYDRPAAGNGAAGEVTLAMRLARVEVSDEQAVKAALALRGRQGRGGNGLRAVPGAVLPWTRGQRRGRGELRQVPPSDPGEARLLRPVQRPPRRDADGPDRGPQQAR